VVAAALCLTLLQGPPPTITPRIATAREWVVRLAREMGDSIWPGFRPDTIPVLYVVPGQGTLLLGWRDNLPPGFLPIEGLGGSGWLATADPGAASTNTELAGHATAQVVVNDTMSIAFLVGTTTHEAFHVFERAARQEGKRFGQAENSFLVSSYPVFDPQNETGMALEGRILETAVQAAKTRKRTLVREFLAVREARQRSLSAELTDFEQQGELNEGLAEYTLVRAVQLVARQGDFPDKQGAAKLLTNKIADLHSLTEDVTQSLRLRFYVTGPALGLLLDALEGPKWKTRLVAENLTVQEALAGASGYRAQELALRREAGTNFGIDKLRTAADSSVNRLRAIRKARVDSVLAAPGVQLVVSVAGRYLGLCGIDPQNLLQVDAGVLLHTRWLKVCAGDALQATFNTPVVQDQGGQVLRAVIGADSTVKVTNAAPGEVEIESPLVSLHAKSAEVARDGRVLTVKVKP
jgi:hypothetical protein